MAGRRKKHYDKSVYRSFALIMQFGINMLVPICLMSALGVWLDEKLDTSYWMVILFFVGAIAGGQNVFRMAKQVYTDSGKGTKASEEMSDENVAADIDRTDVRGFVSANRSGSGVIEDNHQQPEGK